MTHVKKLKIGMGGEFIVIDTVDFLSLKGEISRHFRVDLANIAIKYKDHEGDLITLRSEKDYYDAMSMCSRSEWKLIVEERGVNHSVNKEKINRAGIIVKEILDGEDKNTDELLEILSKVNFGETENSINKMLWEGQFDLERKKRVLFLFQSLFKSTLFSPLIKSDITIPSLYTDLINTNTEKQFLGIETVLEQMAMPLNSRLNYTKTNGTREWFLASVASPGSGKTFLCYSLLQLAMSGSLGSYLKQSLGSESGNYDQLIEKLDRKIVGVQVNCNDGRNYSEIDKISSERDTCLRILCSYYLNRCSTSEWQTFYHSMSHFMPYRIERIIEVILMDWEERLSVDPGQDSPFFIICYDESSKIVDDVVSYISSRNLLIEHFEHVDLPQNGELNDLRKIKIINLVTALTPTEISRQNELGLTKASNRSIAWLTLPNLKNHIEELIPRDIVDSNSKFYYRLGLYWTNGNPRQIEKLLNRLQKCTHNNVVSGKDLMSTVKEISYGEWRMCEETAWKFSALSLCRFSVKPNFFVSNPHTVRDLFLGSLYTSNAPLPLVNLYLDNMIIGECVTSKLYLQNFVSSRSDGLRNNKVSSFIKSALEIETELVEARWEPYLANIFAAQLTCWSFVLTSPDFIEIPNISNNVSNINFHRARDHGCLPLSQLFQCRPKFFNSSKNWDEVMINLKRMDEFDWEVITDFDPKVNVLKAGGIYLPKNPRNPGWDLLICFLNELAEVSTAFFQSKDLQDGNDATLSPLPIGQSICNTINQIKRIQEINRNLKFDNCYYVLFSRKRVPNFNKWLDSVCKRLEKDLTPKERHIFECKDILLGGYYCIDDTDRNTCFGQTLSTFVCRPNDSEVEISKKTLR